MEKIELSKAFSQRLKDAMVEAGFDSQRSASGVSIQKLAEITGYSLQICRKYLRGEAIPEPGKLVELAGKLNVSAGWLMFGDEEQGKKQQNSICISKDLLRYILIEAGYLFEKQHNAEEVSDFLLTLIDDLRQIEADEEQSRKIVQLALASIKQFGNNSN